MNFKPIVESEMAHTRSWSDVSELNYWARKLRFQVFDVTFCKMFEAEKLHKRQEINKIVDYIALRGFRR